MSGRTRSASLQMSSFTSNTGHASNALTVVNSIVSTAVKYTGDKILSSLNPDGAKPVLTETQTYQLQELEVISSLIVVDNEGTVSQPVNGGGGKQLDIVSDGVVLVQDSDIQDSFLQIEETIVIISETTVEKKLVPDSDLVIIHEDFIQAFNDKGPFYMGSLETYTRLWHMLNDKINEMPHPDTRLLIYRDTLDALLKARNVYMDKIRADKEITVVRNKYHMSQVKIKELLEELALCQQEDGLSRFCGALGIRVKQPRPLIYAQALFNIGMAWHIYLHGSPIDPRMFQSTLAYVQSFGDKQNAYSKLIQLLDEYYKDDELEMEVIAQEVKDKVSSSEGSSSQTGTSEQCTSSSEVATSESAGYGSSDYTSGSEHYFSDDEFRYDKRIPGTETLGNYTQDPLYVNLFGQGLMLVMDGAIAIDLPDRFEKGRRKLSRKTKKKSNLTLKIENNEAFYIPTPSQLGDGMMLVMKGELGIDVSDRFERHITQKDEREKTKKRKEKKLRNKTAKSEPRYDNVNNGLPTYKLDPTNWGQQMLVLGGELGIDIGDRFERHKLKKSSRTDERTEGYRFPGEDINDRHRRVNAGAAMYQSDPQGGSPMLILGGELGIDIADRFERHRLKEVRKQKTKKKKEKKEKKKKSKSHKKREHKHEKQATYMFNFFGNDGVLLVLPGCVDIEMTERFTTLDKDTQDVGVEHTHTEACDVEVLENQPHPGNEEKESILSSYISGHPHK